MRLCCSETLSGGGRAPSWAGMYTLTGQPFTEAGWGCFLCSSYPRASPNQENPEGSLQRLPWEPASILLHKRSPDDTPLVDWLPFPASLPYSPFLSPLGGHFLIHRFHLGSTCKGSSLRQVSFSWEAEFTAMIVYNSMTFNYILL